jgi:hypothetical protein
MPLLRLALSVIKPKHGRGGKMSYLRPKREIRSRAWSAPPSPPTHPQKVSNNKTQSPSLFFAPPHLGQINADIARTSEWQPCELGSAHPNLTRTASPLQPSVPLYIPCPVLQAIASCPSCDSPLTYRVLLDNSAIKASGALRVPLLHGLARLVSSDCPCTSVFRQRDTGTYRSGH